LSNQQNKIYLQSLFFRLLDDPETDVVGTLLENIEECVNDIIDQDPKVIPLSFTFYIF
jgi:hypothetical protein